MIHIEKVFYIGKISLMNNMNYIDVIVFIILLVELIKGVRGGIIVPLFDLAGLVFGWFVAEWNAAKFAPLLDNSLHIKAFLTAKLSQLFTIPQSVATLPATSQNLSLAFSALHLPDFIKNFLLKNAQTGSSLTVKQFIVSGVANSILIGITFILIFLLVVIIFRIIGSLIRNAVRVSPFLKWIDAIFGALFRVAIAFVILFVIAQVIVISVGYLHLGNTGFVSQIESSVFYHTGSTVVPFLKTKVMEIITPLLK